MAKERYVCICREQPKDEIIEKQEKCMKMVTAEKRDLKGLSIIGKTITLSHSKRNPNFKHFNIPFFLTYLIINDQTVVKIS